MTEQSFAGINYQDPEARAIFETQAKQRCPKWEKTEKSLGYCDVEIIQTPDKAFVVSGVLKNNLTKLPPTEKLHIKYWAANQPTYNMSFTGSGMAYPNEDIAFQGSKNCGITEVKSNKFSFSINFPNSYYKNMGSEFVGPEVKIKVVNSQNIAVSDIQRISLGENIPFRQTEWPTQRDWSKGPLFYCNKTMPLVRTQFDILKASAYPMTNTTPSNFWSTRPPC